MADVVLLDNLDRSIAYQGIQKIRLPTPGGGTAEYSLSGGGGGALFRGLVEGTLTEVTAADLNGVTWVKDYAFYGCPDLVRAEIPEGCAGLGFWAFAQSGVSEVILPSTTMGCIGEPFDGCSIDVLICRAVTPPDIFYGGNLGAVYIGAIYVPAGSVAAYQAKGGWRDWALVIQAEPT